MFEDMLKRETEIESPNQEELSLTGDAMAQEIRSTNGRCIELPENPSYPLLVKLFLQDNTNLTDIPPSFFEHMPNLEVLDMSNTSVSTLPWSISKLLKLEELLLKRCEMLIELPPEIGSLTNLRVLDLEETELICLPEQIGCLIQLECLRFSLYKYADHHKEGSVISRETLSKLSSLKELSIQVDPECEWWDAEVEAIIDDLGKLGNLETLKLYLPTYQLFKKILELKRIERDGMPLLFPSLSNFRLIVGRREDPIMSRVPRVLQEEFMKLDKCLKYVNLSDYLDVEVLQHVRALFIHRPWSSTKALSELVLTRMNNLRFVLLAECDSMRTIIDYHQLEYGIGNYILRSVYYLGIHYMKNLLRMCERMFYRGCLSNLKILSIHTCPKLTTIFNYGFLEDLVLLEELVIKDCIKLESLVDPSYSNPISILLPSLRKISLLHLPELENISSGQFMAPNLETMVIYNCPNLENLHPLEKCSTSVKVIKGESQWWESKESGWSREQHDYLAKVFVPLKVDDDEDDNYGDELAEAEHISLTSLSQAIERNEDLDIDMKMKGKLEINEDLDIDMKMKGKLERKENLDINMKKIQEDLNHELRKLHYLQDDHERTLQRERTTHIPSKAYENWSQDVMRIEEEIEKINDMYKLICKKSKIVSRSKFSEKMNKKIVEVSKLLEEGKQLETLLVPKKPDQVKKHEFETVGVRDLEMQLSKQMEDIRKLGTILVPKEHEQVVENHEFETVGVRDLEIQSSDEEI